MARTRLVVAEVRAHARLGRGLVALWLLTLLGAVSLPIASAALLGAVVGAVERGTGAVVAPLAALAAVDLALAPCQTYGWVLCWTMGRRYRLAHRQRIMRALLDPPGVAHVHNSATLDAAHTADNVWVVNMLEGVNNFVASRLTGAGGLVIVGVYQPVAAAVLAAAWVVMGSWRWRRVRVTWTVVAGQARTLRRAQAMSDLGLAPVAAKEVRLFGLGTWIGGRYAASGTGRCGRCGANGAPRRAARLPWRRCCSAVTSSPCG